MKGSKIPNVICTLPGTIDSTIIVGAHLDFTGPGSKGALDNWAGASLLPSLLQSIRSIPRRHTFVFIGFTDEEKGLVGSRHYANNLHKDKLKEIRAMINIDSVGSGTTKLELTRGDKDLANALWAVSQTFKLPLQIVNVHAVGRSDSDSFQDRKIPTLNIHSLTNETWPLLHSKKDQLEAVRMTDYYETYRLLTAYLAFLDLVLDQPASPPIQQTTGEPR